METVDEDLHENNDVICIINNNYMKKWKRGWEETNKERMRGKDGEKRVAHFFLLVVSNFVMWRRVRDESKGNTIIRYEREG